MLTKKVRHLSPGDRFLTPGGTQLTVTDVRIDWQSLDGYVVSTVEEYLPGERFTADGDVEVWVIHDAWSETYSHERAIAAAYNFSQIEAAAGPGEFSRLSTELAAAETAMWEALRVPDTVTYLRAYDSTKRALDIEYRDLANDRFAA